MSCNRPSGSVQNLNKKPPELAAFYTCCGDSPFLYWANALLKQLRLDRVTRLHIQLGTNVLEHQVVVLVL